jgi:hypothetical protein
MPSLEEVAQFLAEFRAAARLGFVRWLERSNSSRKQVQCLIDLNLTQNQAIEIICGLTADSYCRGPDPDDVEPTRNVWIFGAVEKLDEIYIKLALQPDKHRKSVVHGLIWSFHRADYPLQYPLRGP